MMGTTADKLEYLQGTKAAIKSAIINKGVAVPDGTTFRQYAEKIGDIIDVPDLSNPGAAGDLRSGKQLVGADGSIVTGTLPEVIQATPTISVSSGGLITASATQSGGIVEGGSKSATQQLTTQAAKTVTPGTTNQTAVASGRYTTGDVDVAGDANLVPENIAEGVSIFGVAGTHSGGSGGSVDYFQGEVEPVAVDEHVNMFTITLPIESSKNVFALIGNPEFWDTSPKYALEGMISFANGETYGAFSGAMALSITRNSAESVIRGIVAILAKVKYFVFAVSG